MICGTEHLPKSPRLDAAVADAAAEEPNVTVTASVLSEAVAVAETVAVTAA